MITVSVRHLLGRPQKKPYIRNAPEKKAGVQSTCFNTIWLNPCLVCLECIIHISLCVSLCCSLSLDKHPSSFEP